MGRGEDGCGSRVCVAVCGAVCVLMLVFMQCLPQVNLNGTPKRKPAICGESLFCRVCTTNHPPEMGQSQ